MRQNNDDIDPEDREGLREEESAFRESESYTFKGTRLEPFSFVRKTAAIALGLQYGRLDPATVREFPNPDYVRKKAIEEKLAKLREKIKKARAPVKAALTTDARKMEAELEPLRDEPDTISTYDGILMDAALVIWLCLQPDSVCQRARRKPQEYEGVIDKWADREGIAGAYMSEATQLFGRIIAHENRSRGKPKVKEREAGGN